MARHFLALYLLIVLTLAAVSWGQDKLLQVYGNQDTADDRGISVALVALQGRLQGLPTAQWQRFVADAAADTGADIELFATTDIAGRETLDKLRRGKIAYLQAAAGESWAMMQLDADHVLAFKSSTPEPQRGALEWAITLLFYAVIALVLMVWIWPLTRDLRALEGAAARFGDKNWRFDAAVRPGSQIYALAETFRKMAMRIDGLIASHKDMSNAVSHEIKTPLARMQFEIELAQQAHSDAEVKASLGRIKSDIAAINELVSATLSYAILERADMALNLGTHNLTALVPAITDYVKRDVRPDIHMSAESLGDTDHVICDAHLIETVLKNLLYNAARYAKGEVRVSFAVREGVNQLFVDDDGPGILEPDRLRVFDSFVQLAPAKGKKTGFGLGLAIVRRAIEWHGGTVMVVDSPLGGARFCASWPIMSLHR